MPRRHSSFNSSPSLTVSLSGLLHGPLAFSTAAAAVTTEVVRSLWAGDISDGLSKERCTCYRDDCCISKHSVGQQLDCSPRTIYSDGDLLCQHTVSSSAADPRGCIIDRQAPATSQLFLSDGCVILQTAACDSHKFLNQYGAYATRREAGRTPTPDSPWQCSRAKKH